MKLWLVAVGQRLPAWAETAYEDYAKRFPPELRLQLKAVKAEPRGGSSAERLMAAEAQRIEAALPRGVRRIALDGRDAALLIGGPDGLDPALKAGADERLRLSDLTLPHAFARVLLAEGLYRAWTVVTGHPYHRE
ncbi:23S rRNA (pseudouridine(1915)-N(3))-methyltransferase RlmH [Piscinibacter sakaiensis]|uniref:23S rRNA (pseudouridine(1915)-N(3))-methyltransferase RlmH n=1 Tax=Piscinibacter sakaiensis TaxID=1547922 RepID=UPI00372C0FA9